MTGSSPTPYQEPRPVIDTSVAHTARVWNYWLGGKDNYPIDQEVGEQIRALVPDIADSARADRGFLLRAVRYLTTDSGIRQFLDIGTGLPTANNTHDIAQTITPQCRVVYADHDPLVLAHARALLTSTPRAPPTTSTPTCATPTPSRLWNDNATPSIVTRTRQELTRFFDRLELLEPGVVSCSLWRPDPADIGTPTQVYQFGGIGRKLTSERRG